jgi:hypothetical protein
VLDGRFFRDKRRAVRDVKAPARLSWRTIARVRDAVIAFENSKTDGSVYDRPIVTRLNRLDAPGTLRRGHAQTVEARTNPPRRKCVYTTPQHIFARTASAALIALAWPLARAPGQVADGKFAGSRRDASFLKHNSGPATSRISSDGARESAVSTISPHFRADSATQSKMKPPGAKSGCS